MTIHIMPNMTHTELESLEYNTGLKINVQGLLVQKQQVKRLHTPTGLNLKPIATRQVRPPAQPTPPAAA